MSALHHHHQLHRHLRHPAQAGEAEVYVPPSSFHVSPLTVNTWARRIPTPGIPFGAAPLAAVTASPSNAMPTCADLLAASPPSLLERYELLALSIDYALIGQFGAAPTAQFELALLVNDRVRYSQVVVPSLTAVVGVYGATGTITADLFNPLLLGARDRLSLRAGAIFSQAVTAGAWPAGMNVYIGAQSDNAGNPIAGESVIRYRVMAEAPYREFG